MTMIVNVRFASLVRRHALTGALAQRPAAMFDMGGLADDAFGEDDLVDRPADRRRLFAQSLTAQPVAAIVGA